MLKIRRGSNSKGSNAVSTTFFAKASSLEMAKAKKANLEARGQILVRVHESEVFPKRVTRAPVEAIATNRGCLEKSCRTEMNDAMVFSTPVSVKMAPIGVHNKKREMVCFESLIAPGAISRSLLAAVEQRGKWFSLQQYKLRRMSSFQLKIVLSAIHVAAKRIMPVGGAGHVGRVRATAVVVLS